MKKLLILLTLSACGTIPDKAATPYGESTYGNEVGPMNVCSLPKEDRPEKLLGRDYECTDDEATN